MLKSSVGEVRYSIVPSEQYVAEQFWLKRVIK